MPTLAARSRAPRRPARSSTAETIRYGVADSPLGRLFVAATDQGLCAITFLEADDPRPGLDKLRDDFPGASFEADEDLAASVAPRIVAYMAEGDTCADLALDLRGTPFQVKVWNALRDVPHGETRTYGQIAQAIGLPISAARAVGTACGSNRITLLVPCHRIVGANGGLGGYYWGLERKRTLLDMERDGRE